MSTKRVQLVVWLAWRSVTASPRDAVLRLAVGALTVIAVLIGCSLAPTALNRSDRVADSLLPMAPAHSQDSGVRVTQAHDYFEGEPISVVTVAVVGRSTPSTFAGIPIPEPGELAISPGLAEERRESAELRRRYPGTVVGGIPESLLIGPRSFVVWRGVAPREMSAHAGWLTSATGVRNDDVRTSVPDVLGYAYPVLIIGFLLPLLALVAVLATLGASRREQRLASMRLIGLSDQAAKWSVALEEAVLSLFSLALGGALFQLLAPLVAESLPAQGGVWAEDIQFAWPATGLLLGMLPVLSVLLSLLGLRRLTTSPLGVERRTSARRPSRWRLAPLVVGAVLLLVAQLPLIAQHPWTSALLLGAAALLSVGLIGGLPFLATGVSRLMLRGPLWSLLAGRRIEADPLKASRVAAGLTTLMVASGLMLVFFPLVSELGSDDYAAAGEKFGGDTLFGHREEGGDPTAVAAWRSVAESDEVQSGLAVQRLQVARPGRRWQQISVLVVDCEELTVFADVPVEDCERGLRTTGPARWPGRIVQAVRESSGDGKPLPVGTSFKLPARAVESDVVELMDGIASSGAHLAVPAHTVPVDVSVQASPTVMFVRPVPGGLESARTHLLAAAGVSSLTLDEQFQISTFSTRQFQMITWLAALLAAAVAGLATIVAAYEQVRSTRAERRLLAVGGAKRCVASRSLVLQVMVPVITGVCGGTVVTTLLCGAFVQLLADQGGTAHVPVAEILATAVVSLTVPALATLAVLRLESADELLAGQE